MHLRNLRTLAAVLGCASALLALPASAKAADAANDEFSAMRVRRITPPMPAGKLVLQATDGRSIRLSDYRGKAVLVEFFLTN
jgi:hypothetical protein